MPERPQQRERSNVVIFAGAGASKALPETEFPTTVEFFQSLPTSVRDDDNFTFLDSFVRSTKASKTIDIEDVLLELQTLISFLKDSNNDETVIGRAVSRNLIGSLNQNWGF